MGSPPLAVGSPPALNLLSSGSPPVPTPSSQHLAQNGTGLPKAPPTVSAVGLPRCQVRGALVHLWCQLQPCNFQHQMGLVCPRHHPPSMRWVCLRRPVRGSSGSPTVPSPPPPPPWSVHLPSHPRMIICGKCLAGCHSLQFKMCYACYAERGSP